MSQSDYIEYKRRAVELKRQSSLPPILSEEQYIGFKQFAAENNISSTGKISTSKTYNQLVPVETKIIFDIARANTEECSTYIVDSGTQLRPNRTMTLATGCAIQPPKYVKFPKIVCKNCCNDTSNLVVNSNKNNANTDFMLCRMSRLKNKLCNCSSLQ
jgi:hypothetical protein